MTPPLRTSVVVCAVAALFSITLFAQDAPLRDRQSIQAGGLLRELEVAKDEFHVLRADGKHEIKKVPAAASVQAIAQLADAEGKRTGLKANLLLYETGQERSEGTRWRVTDKLIVQLDNGQNAEAVRQAVGAQSQRALGYAPGFHVFEVAGVAQALVVAERLKQRNGVRAAEPLLSGQFQKRLVLPPPTTDPLFPNQWHLRNTGQNGGTAGIDANVLGAWANQQGNGVVIGVLDDSLQHSHPDLIANANTAIDFDFLDNDADPSPVLADENHGTAVGGIAGARGFNDLGVRGAAPQATLVGVRLIGEATTDDMVADAFAHQNDLIQVKNNSWGPVAWLAGPSAIETAALTQAIQTGRGGKGEIFVFAAGNSRQSRENANYDGYNNSIYTISVGAISDLGNQAAYSESGACLVVSAPSFDFGRQGTTTTDRTGAAGYNTGSTGGELPDADYTQTFGGTSSAAPLVSGVVALMLQANPNLGWRDVQEILIRSATKVSPNDAGWANNGAGLHFHHGFGGGMVNAAEAVGLSQSWTNLAAQTSAFVEQSGLSVPIPDNDTNGLTRALGFAANMRVEHVVIRTTITHSYRGDLVITLTSPSGTTSVLAEERFDPGDGYSNWAFSSTRHWGESSTGIWTVKISDEAEFDLGSLNFVRVDLYGTAATSSPGALRFVNAAPLIDESAGTAKIGVTRVGGSAGPVSVQYATANGTATAGSDYTAASGTLNWADGDIAAKFIAVPIANDASGEADETINLTLSNPTGGATLGTPNAATVTIDDDDPATAGSVQFTTATYSVQENGGTATITVSRTGGSGAISVQYATANGTATAGSDYTAASGALNWAAGDTANKTFTVPITNDALTESNETINLTLSNPTGGATLGSPASATLTITDDDAGAPNCEYASDANTIALYHFQGGYTDSTGNGLTLTPAGGATRSTAGAWAGESACFANLGDTLSVSIPDSLMAPPTFQGLTIDAMMYVRAYKGGSSARANLLQAVQAFDASLEMFQAQWQAGPRFHAGSTSVGPVTIPLNQWKHVRMTLDAAGVARFYVDGVLQTSGAASLNLSRTTPWVFQFGEFDGCIDEVRLSNVVRADGAPSCGPAGPTLQFTAATYSVQENGGSATITVSRLGSTTGAVSAQYATANGTATAGSDYTAASGTLNWAVGDASNKTFTVPILDDASVEGNETVALTLSSPTGGATLGSPAAATLTIQDNDVAASGTLQFTAATYSAQENGGTATITVSRANGSGGAVSVQYSTANGTATAGSDYTAASGTLNWAAGDASNKTFTVPILDDAADEPDETVLLSLSNPSGGATLASPSSASLSIVDDDPPPGGGGGDYVVDANTIALYHFGGNYNDSSANNLHLTPAGNVSRATIAGRASEAACFLNLGDKLSVTIPDSLMAPAGFQGLTVEALMYVRAFKGGSSARANLLQAVQAFDASLETFQAQWQAGPRFHVGSASIGPVTVPLNQWKHVRMSVDAAGVARFFLDGALQTSATVSLNLARTSPWVFEVGEFDGCVDEVRVSNVARTDGPPGGGGPQPGTLQFTSATYSVGESGGTATVTVSRTGGASGAVSVSYATANGTASAGSDYASASGALNWADGDASNKTFTVTILNDATVEPNETVALSLSGPTGGAALGSPSSATLTITDDDTPPPTPTVAFTAASQSRAETGGAFQVTAQLSSSSASTVTVPFTVSGTAGNPADYAFSPASPLTFAPGATTASLTVIPVADAVADPNETIIFTLGVPTNAILGSPSVHTATLTEASGGNEFILDADTIALYHFNGNFADSSPNNLTLTPTGTVTRSSVGAWAGESACFTNLGQKLSVNIPDSLMATAPFPGLTIEALMRVTSFSGGSNVRANLLQAVQGFDASLEFFQAHWQSGPRYQSGLTSVGPVTLPTGQWKHIRMTLDSGNVARIYVNGVLSGSATTSLNLARTTVWVLEMGEFNGCIDEARISRGVRADPPLGGLGLTRVAAQRAPRAFAEIVGVERDGDDVRLAVKGESGRAFVLERSDDLRRWSTVRELEGAGEREIVRVTGPQAARYFRLRFPER